MEEFPLSLTIIVDNHAYSWMVSKAAYKMKPKKPINRSYATNNLALQVIFTDADAAMVAAIQMHMYYIVLQQTSHVLHVVAALIFHMISHIGLIQIMVVYEHQIETNFDILHEIHNTQVYSDTVNQNLSHKAKYNQGIRNAKRAIELVLQVGCESELNLLLQDFNTQFEKMMVYSRQNSSDVLGEASQHSIETLNENEGKYTCSYCIVKE
ncbi:hypothetical protein Glove_251g40 [Diversispora epigaea]|uniref:Uncharacterized protein n=1 Tax=Diversispora epigaea TaxID=1348612 RepID=A0A397I7Y5_9GLOM|nr:hypothetical protein Glove_251g40 [Diversispora epigaea]